MRAGFMGDRSGPACFGHWLEPDANSRKFPTAWELVPKYCGMSIAMFRSDYYRVLLELAERKHH